MRQNGHPRTWHIANWHPDFGNLADELEPLRELAILLIERSPGVQIALENSEPGLIFLDGTFPNGGRFEAYRCWDDRLGVFTNPDSAEEGEQYFASPQAAADFLTKLSR